MYRHILIPLENSPADETILAHIKPLARMTGAKLLLVHVSDGWVARNFNQLKLAESEKNVDLVAMTTHGHRFVSDILYGATADKVRHEVDVPVLLLKVKT